MKFKATLIAISLLFTVLTAPSSAATSYKLLMSLRQTPSASGVSLTLYGSFKSAKPGTIIKVQVESKGKWVKTKLTAKLTKVRTWKVTTQIKTLNSKKRYRVVALVRGKKIYSPARAIKIKQQPEISEIDPALFIDVLGPGGRIHGADISRWQHPNNSSIDFVKMYNAGLRFVFIKGSDTREDADRITVKYASMDYHAAQAAGIYTGFYHYAVLPDVTDPQEIKKDALAQAQKVVWRLAAMGGYGEKDLPYALDLENKCVRRSASGACQKYASRGAVTLWATTFLASVKAKTGKPPIVYSYASFLENSMIRSAELAQYPLWLARYKIDPANPTNHPGMKNAGCYVHSWTDTNCDSQWTVWQYTSCGIADKYGVPSARLDLNVFRGTPSSFLDLAKGTWVPTSLDLMPVQEVSTMTLLSQKASTTNKKVTFKISVSRPNGAPVVTGDVKFVFEKTKLPKPKPQQSSLRETSGVWTLALKGVPAGTYTGNIVYEDVSTTHATSRWPVTFTVTQAPAPTPSPSPTAIPSPTPTKKPTTNGCRSQIKN